jgi:transcriptional regulator with XRE-family HTH domain
MDDPIDRLIAAVEKSGLKQTHIAQVAHLHRTKLNKILKRNQIPTVPEFIDISRAINLDPALLFTEGDLVVELTALREAHAAAQRATEVLARWLPEQAVQHAETPRAQPKRSASRFRTPVGAAADPNAELVVELEEEQKEIPIRAWNQGARIIARASATRWTEATTRSATAPSSTSSQRAIRRRLKTRSRWSAATTVCF